MRVTIYLLSSYSSYYSILLFPVNLRFTHFASARVAWYYTVHHLDTIFSLPTPQSFLSQWLRCVWHVYLCLSLNRLHKTPGSMPHVRTAEKRRRWWEIDWDALTQAVSKSIFQPQCNIFWDSAESEDCLLNLLGSAHSSLHDITKYSSNPLCSYTPSLFAYFPLFMRN